MNNLVSIITPAWNSEKYIYETIKSVQLQTYKHWEMLIVDDNSTDNTINIVEKISKFDPRIKLLKQTENKGPGAARTLAMLSSIGRYIAYLDADDLWYPQKLEKQIKFMQENNYSFSCTSYEVIHDSGRSLNKYIHMPFKLDYIGYLKNNLLQTVSIMVDIKQIDKKYLYMPNIRMGEDAATWLQILKAGYNCYGLDEILAMYRRTPKSLSSNKFKSVIGTWHMYKDIVNLPMSFAVYCFVRYLYFAIKKRI